MKNNLLTALAGIGLVLATSGCSGQRRRGEENLSSNVITLEHFDERTQQTIEESFEDSEQDGSVEIYLCNYNQHGKKTEAIGYISKSAIEELKSRNPSCINTNLPYGLGPVKVGETQLEVMDQTKQNEIDTRYSQLIRK